MVISSGTYQQTQKKLALNAAGQAHKKLEKSSMWRSDNQANIRKRHPKWCAGVQWSRNAGEWLLSIWQEELVDRVKNNSAAFLVLLKSDLWALLHASSHKARPDPVAMLHIWIGGNNHECEGYQTHFKREDGQASTFRLDSFSAQALIYWNNEKHGLYELCTLYSVNSHNKLTHPSSVETNLLF